MKKTTIKNAVMMMAVIFFTGGTQAQQLCMSSKIKSIKLHRNESRLYVEPEGSIHNSYLYNSGRYIDIWQKDSYARWTEKYSLITMAHALNKRVEIYSSDYNCMGNQDEFTIELKP